MTGRRALARRGRPVLVNARFMTQPLTGVQRVARELLARLETHHRAVRPVFRLPGPAGHGWEQTVLAMRSNGAALWSPCNSGPIQARRHAVTIHDAAVLDHPEWFSPRFAEAYRWLWPRLAKRARIVTVSAFSQSRLAERLGLDPDQIAVVPNGVDRRFAPAAPEAIARTRNRLGLGERPYFIVLSTLEPRKNLRLVLDAWRLASLRRNGARLVVVGGVGDAAVFAAAPAVGGPPPQGVIFTGRLPDADLTPLISGARGLLYPSLYEGFGLPLLEGMACGVPVVATRSTSLPEVGGDVAFYVDARDPADLASLMMSLIDDDDLVSERGALGLGRAAGFGWPRAAAAMDDILADL